MLFLLFVLLFLWNCTCNVHNSHHNDFITHHKVVKDDNGTYYLIYTKKGYSRKIPAEETVMSLGFDPSRVPLATETTFLQYPHEDKSIQSISWNSSHPEIHTNALIERILTLSPPIFWKKTFYLPDMFNPTIQYWLNKTLLVYREQMYDVPIRFEWFSFRRSREVIFPKPDDYGLRNIHIPKYDFNQLQEDARLLVRSNGSSVLVQYHCKASLFSPPKTCYIHMYLDPSSNGKRIIHMTDSQVIDDHPFEQKAQKNWISIEGNDGRSIYFIQSINPFHLILHNESNLATRVGKAYLVEQREEIPLPWAKEYGLPLRGGTPTHLLRNLSALMNIHPQEHEYPTDGSNHSKALFPDNLRVAFFHTVSAFRWGPIPRTYFMGCITFCANYPFQIYSISAHPILLRKFYQGKWADPKIDYVMFPTGIFEKTPEHEREDQQFEAEEDDNEKDGYQQEEASKDQTKMLEEDVRNERYIWVTFGYGDKNGAIAKLHLKELLKSMEIIGHCSADR
jgi:hypothetical protein